MFIFLHSWDTLKAYFQTDGSYSMCTSQLLMSTNKHGMMSILALGSPLFIIKWCERPPNHQLHRNPEQATLGWSVHVLFLHGPIPISWVLNWCVVIFQLVLQAQSSSIHKNCGVQAPPEWTNIKAFAKSIVLCQFLKFQHNMHLAVWQMWLCYCCIIMDPWNGLQDYVTFMTHRTFVSVCVVQDWVIIWLFTSDRKYFLWTQVYDDVHRIQVPWDTFFSPTPTDMPCHSTIIT